MESSASPSPEQDEPTQVLKRSQEEPVPTQVLKRSTTLPNVSRFSIRKLVIAGSLFIAGILVGVLGLSAFLLLGNADHSLATVPSSSQSGSIVIQADLAYINHVIQRKAGSFSVPGTLKNVQVVLVHNGPITITGDDDFSLFGVVLTRHFSLDMQLYASACKPTAHVVRASFGGLPITGFAASFEQSLNTQLQGEAPSDLPSGFTYCLTAIHTEPQGAVMTYSAQPLA